jgi:hypothetical protein
MATRIPFLSGQETAVTEAEDEVVKAVRRDHPNPIKLEGLRSCPIRQLEPRDVDRAAARTAAGALIGSDCAAWPQSVWRSNALAP